MSLGVLITNGAPHSAEKWAVATAEHIFRIDEQALAGNSERLLQAKRVQIAIAEALMPHHGTVQTHERGQLVKDETRFEHHGDPEEAHVDAALAAVVSATSGTPWETQFKDAAVQAAIKQEIGTHFRTSIDIERQWHADRNPHLAKGRAYKAAKTPAVANVNSEA